MDSLFFTPASRLRQFRQSLKPPAATATVASPDEPQLIDALWRDKILDPSSDVVNVWNHVFLIACLISLSLDPLYFYIPYVGGTACMSTDNKASIAITYFRTITDFFYVINMLLKFRTAFVAPSSRVFGRGELIVIWIVIPATKGNGSGHDNNTIALIVLIQYLPRLLVSIPLNQRIIKTTGFIAKTAWAGAAYNLLLFMLASHCRSERNAVPPCIPSFLDCESLYTNSLEREYWLNTTSLLTRCDPKNEDSDFKFGMFADAFTSEVASSPFVEKYLYCLWWGLRNLSSYGQNLRTSTYIGETLFCIFVCINGLILFSHLIGNMQLLIINFCPFKTYLQSLTVRLEEWRIKRRDTEEWMRHRQLPPELQERVRRFDQYKWLATRGVKEESILQSLPLDLRREIQRHLCLNLVRRVPFFAQMDDQLLDAICERLVSSLSTKATYIVREGDPVNEMLFVIRGQLESSTTNGGRSGFFNSITLRPGDFCGEELLTWALVPNSLNLPSSTRTVRTLSEVEAFALRAEDLKFFAVQFKHLHSKKLQHAFRYYSHQWRTWGACYIQVAWRRYKKKKLAKELSLQESYYYMSTEDGETYIYDENYVGSDDGADIQSSEDGANNAQHLGATILASKFAANTRRGIMQKVQVSDSASSSLKMPKLFKPQEPDFS
nr:cyclic nucleotide-gated ion channel 18 [Ipomoea batatas]